MPSVEVKTREISRTLETICYTKRIETNCYWDAHGKKVYWKDKNEVFKYSEPKKIELYRIEREYFFSTLPSRVWEFLELYVDGERLDVGEITEFRELRTKVKLQCCIGAG